MESGKMWRSIHGSARVAETFVPMRVQQEQAVRRQAAPGDVEVLAVIPWPTCSNIPSRRRDRTLSSLAVVLDVQLDRQPLAALAERRLLLRQRHALHRHAVARGGVLRDSAPAAADVEHAHAGLQGQLADSQIELRLLRPRGRDGRRAASRRRYRSCACRASARTGRCPGRSGAPDLETASPRLQVQQPREDRVHDFRDAARRLVEARVEYPEQHSVERSCLPSRRSRNFPPVRAILASAVARTPIRHGPACPTAVRRRLRQPGSGVARTVVVTGGGGCWRWAARHPCRFSPAELGRCELYVRMLPGGLEWASTFTASASLPWGRKLRARPYSDQPFPGLRRSSAR